MSKPQLALRGSLGRWEVSYSNNHVVEILVVDNSQQCAFLLEVLAFYFEPFIKRPEFRDPNNHVLEGYLNSEMKERGFRSLFIL